MDESMLVLLDDAWCECGKLTTASEARWNIKCIVDCDGRV